MRAPRDVTVVVPTQGLASRAHLLERAVRSVLEQQGVDARVLAVVNGASPDPRVRAWLEEQPRVHVLRRKEAGLAGALQAGTRAAETTFVGTLDDDDLLLPNALAPRLDALGSHPEWDAVVTNGLRRTDEGDIVHVEDMEAVARDPLGSLARANWLLPGAWTGRTERVVPSLLEGVPDNAECTYTALRLGLEFRIGFLAEPTVVWHTDTVGSMSKAKSHILRRPAAARRILQLDLPPEVRRHFRVKQRLAAHHVAELHLREGRLGPAWRWHLTSLMGPGGYRHLWYTRRLIAALWRP